MAKKKKVEETPKIEENENEDENDIFNVDYIDDFEDDLEDDSDGDLDGDLDLKKLLRSEDLDAEIEKKEKLIDKDEAQKQLYLSCGIHIGTKLLTGDARRFIYRQTNYGLYVIDLTQTDERLKIASKFLSKFVDEGSDRIIVSSVRRYGKEPVSKFCEVLGCRAIITRFIPGSLTNPIIETYIKDASVVVIIDPHADKTILKLSLIHI